MKSPPFNTKEVRNAWKTFDRCRTRKCSALIKRKKKNDSKFEKEQAIACPQKNDHAFYECSIGFYHGSKQEKLAEAVSKCSTRKCSKERKRLSNARNQGFLDYAKGLVFKV